MAKRVPFPVPSPAGPATMSAEEATKLKDLALGAAAEGITIADLRQPDEPIVYANDGFARLTGYAVEEVLGRNCRFLQGEETDPEAVARLRRAVRNGEGCTVDILNYRKDGQPFWNRLAITPVRDEDGALTHYVGIQSDITARKRAEEELAEANRRMSRSLQAAAAIQRSLLPDTMPDVPGLEFAWTFEPCDELAGDSLNVFRVDDEHLVLYMLDVVGHGVPAALLSVTLAQVLSFSRRQASLSGQGSFADRRLVCSPKATVERLNQLFPMNLESRQYFTLLYGVLHLPTLQLRYVTAGHPAPVLLPADGPCRNLTVGGFPVGVAKDPDYVERTAQLDPGDRLFIYTDGLLEAADEDGREFGAARLHEEIQRGRDLPLRDGVEALETAAKSWAGGKLPDDLSILGLGVDRG